MESTVVKGTGKCQICGKPLFGAEIGKTCQSHVGKIRATAQVLEKAPEGWVRMSKVCDAAEKVGLTRGSVVVASGGDACTKPIADPVFQVIYVGRAKFLHPDALVKGIELLKAGKTAPKAEKPTEAKEVAQVASALKQVVKK